MRTLLFSSLYPSAVRPSHGIFVETRLRELLKTGAVETRVIAPVPWFPLAGERFGEYGQFAATPREDTRHGIAVQYPRYLLLPKVGMNMAPASIARAAWPAVQRLLAQGFDFDLIDAHYYYPDAVAAAIIARRLGKPFVVTARGTDLNLIPDYPKARRRILETADQAAASIGVCKALMDKLAQLGADPAKLHVLRNGVDLQRFRSEPMADARTRLGLPAGGTMLLAVGHLIERKGQRIAIEALPQLPQALLCLVGRGPDEAALKALAKRLGVHDRVRLVGAVDNAELRWWYSAADASLLCSSREGWANVLLESMACGTPVLATDIWGTPEVVAAPEAGVLMEERTAVALVSAWHRLCSNGIRRVETRRYAEQYSWGSTSHGQLALFRQLKGPSERAVQ
ncbi:MAG: glycosyltransferase [Rubrivivax sp.]|nr:glycosyltransferase [Rubrivivax sp.]